MRRSDSVTNFRHGLGIFLFSTTARPVSGPTQPSI